jgi:hypothetical protein
MTTPLDDLLLSAGRVPEISDEGMRSGLDDLDAAIARASDDPAVLVDAVEPRP